jgi:hypothetical protein
MRWSGRCVRRCKSFDAQREVRAAAVVHDGVNFVENDRARGRSVRDRIRM